MSLLDKSNYKQIVYIKLIFCYSFWFWQVFKYSKRYLLCVHRVDFLKTKLYLAHHSKLAHHFELALINFQDRNLRR